jgi:hypothetical protein
MHLLAFACVASLGAAIGFADPTDRAIIAVMKLSEAPNYSWFSIIDDESSSYEIEGKTIAAGITWVRMPTNNSLGRRLGRETDSQVEALVDRGTTAVVRIGNEWKSLGELSAERERDLKRQSRGRTMVRGSANAGSFGIPGGRSLGAAAPFLEDKRGSTSFTHQQFGVTHPHDELAIIVSSHTTMDVSGDVATGTLSDIGAALLLLHAEQTDVEPITTSGRFKLWFKNGVVNKYQLILDGVVVIGSRKKMNVHVNSTTTVKDIGTTQVNVPDDAREKLGL